MDHSPKQPAVATHLARKISVLAVACAVGAAAVFLAMENNASSANPSQGSASANATSRETAPPSQPTSATRKPPLAAHSMAAANANPVEAQKEIESILQGVVKSMDMPGMAAAVIVDGKILAAGTAGVRKKGMPDPVLLDDPFHLGSCTKALTATLIGILVDEGKLKWDSAIGDLIGRDINGIHPEYAPVTIDQLLHHRSGSWPNGPSEVWSAAQNAKGSPQEQRAAYVDSILTIPPRFAAGKYLYSNAGYAVLGFIAEKVTNTPYETLMREKVFAPLGLTSAGFGNAGSDKELTAPFPHVETGLPNFLDNPEAITAAGRIHMNVTDWAKFCLVHLGHQPTPPLLTPQTLEHLHTLAGDVAQDKFGYACGWMRPNREWAGGRTLHHYGSNTLNFCVVWMSPVKDFGVLVATNQGGKKADQAVNDAASEMIDRFLLLKK